jgi:uncharacterized protein (TIGR02300 family)
MTKAALGAKRKCLECGTSFFDLQRTPILCPRCKTTFVPPPPPPLPVYKRKTQIPLESPTAAEPEALVENDPEVEANEDEEAAIEDDLEPAEPDEDPNDDVLPLNE